MGGGCKHIKSLRDSNSSLFKLDLDLNQFKFPLIIKPRFGSGSRDVLVITTDNELKEICKNDKFTKEDFLIEEFINGIEYGLDAVVIDGKFHHILIREKQITSLPYRQAIASISIDEIPAISIYMQKIINAHCHIYPEKIADNFSKSGAYIPGIRPGKETERYISKVLNRVTLMGAGFITLIAVLPYILQIVMGYFSEYAANLASGFGGTSIIIVVGVALETVKEIEGRMAGKDYSGLSMKNTY